MNKAITNYKTVKIVLTKKILKLFTTFFILSIITTIPSLNISSNDNGNLLAYVRLKEILSIIKKPIVIKSNNPNNTTIKYLPQNMLDLIESAQRYYLSNKMETEYGSLNEYQIHLRWALEHEEDIDNYYKNHKYQNSNSNTKKEIFISKLTDAIANNKINLKDLLNPYLFSINAKVD